MLLILSPNEGADDILEKPCKKNLRKVMSIQNEHKSQQHEHWVFILSKQFVMVTISMHLGRCQWIIYNFWKLKNTAPRS